MARYTGPTCKLARREGVDLELKPTYKQLQTGVREKEKVETKSESATKS
jgi:hypothetical protein